MAGYNFTLNIHPLSGINKLYLSLTTSEQLNFLQSAGQGGRREDFLDPKVTHLNLRVHQVASLLSCSGLKVFQLAMISLTCQDCHLLKTPDH